MANNTTRQSNFELLRVVCMLGILTNHTLQNLWNIHVPEITWANECRIFLMNAAILAVNCFVMISGYFTIKLSWKGLVKYYAQCFFYMALFGGISYAIGTHNGVHTLSQILFACTEGDWFVRCYFALMLISPLLNAALRSLNNIERKLSLILLLVIDVYMGYMHQVKEVAPEGYELVHLITMYVLGNYISKTEIKKANWGFWLLLTLLAMTGLHMLKMRFFPISIIYSLHYNSPCLVLASVLLFLWARTWTIQSNNINWIAGSVFAIYLIHCNPYFSPYYWSVMKAIRDIGPWYITPFLVGGASLLAYSLFIGIDKLRLLVFQPMETKIANYLQNHFPICLTR